MIKRVEIVVPLDKIHDEEWKKKKLFQKLGLKKEKEISFALAKRSIDARGSQPVFRLFYDVGMEEELPGIEKHLEGFTPIKSSTKDCIIIGAGPAGYFAALELIELGIKPIILERGKGVQERRRDLRAIQQFGEVNPHSNYCFGEGGAG
ncbi:MAG: FAD-dependent monooxygenase, partial [Saprospiraceae bacterium]